MSFDFSQFKGVHKVTKKPERVWVGNWSIEVPVGFTYTVDPNKTGSGAMGTYQLHVQSSKDCNFNEAYSSAFNVVVYGKLERITCNCNDMSSPKLLESLKNLPSHLLKIFQIYKSTKDIAILYSILNETKEYTMYDFQVIVRGRNIAYSGQFNCCEGSIPERKKSILRWLDTIDTLTEEERLSFSDYSGKSKIKIPTYFNKETAAIDRGVKISIPRGFHSETNPLVIGEQRKLVIVPNDYSLSDDPMGAPIALTAQVASNDFPTREDAIDQYFEFFCRTGQAFHLGQAVQVNKYSDKAISLTQSFLSVDEHAAISRTALFSGNILYIITIIIDYYAADFDTTFADWDILHFAKAWLGRIQVTGETVPDYPSRCPLTSSDKLVLSIADPARSLYPHYDQLGDTSKPKAKTVGSGGTAVFITNAGGTEFESYPFSNFEGELEAVASRVCGKDCCNKEYKQLVSKAVTYAALFRVDKAVFNHKEDRECDIRNLRMRRSYQLHILRSFAWTLAESAASRQKSVSDLPVEEYPGIIEFIEKRKYLNYKADSHFPTLCGTADLHVSFVPGKTAKADKEALAKTEDLFGNTIPNTIASLEGLRKDLLGLAAPMDSMFQWLLGTRDYSKPLTGVAADVLYAWCTMVLSAETPFYMEDGPMTCFYTQITEPEVPTLVETKTQRKKVTKESVANTSTKTALNVDGTQSKKLPGRKFYEVDADLRLIRYKGNAYDKMSLTIPKDVAVIGSGAIVDDEQVRFVIIPKSVTMIEAGAFQNLPKLIKVIVPDTDIKIDKEAFINCPQYCIDTFSGSPTEKHCKRYGIPYETDDSCKIYFPEIVRKREKAEAKAKAKAEAEARAKAEAEHKRIEEENRLKRIAATLQQKLTALYQERLQQSQNESLKRAVAAAIADTCDRQTWGEIRKRKIPAIPMVNLSETHKKLESVAPEESYDLLPEWIAEEYIHTAEEKRIQFLRAEEEKKARLAFETVIRELNGIANESVLPLFESGIEKNEILGQFVSQAKATVGEGMDINTGLAKYNGNPILETFKVSLGHKPFDSAVTLIDAIIEKKSAEIDQLTKLLEKKNSDIEAIEQEKAALEEERAHLGFFHGKRKKEIAALLEAIPEKIKAAEDEYEKAKKSVG